MPADPGLLKAFASHGAGRLQEAVAGYKAFLATDARVAPIIALLSPISGRAVHAMAAPGLVAPVDPASVEPPYVAVWFDLAIAYGEAALFVEAAACYRQAIAADVRFAPAHVNLGAVLLELGDAEEAIACQRTALWLRPRMAPAQANLAAALHRQGWLDEAESECRRALSLAAAWPELLVLLGRILGERNRHEGAEACFRKALALESRLFSARLGLVEALLSQDRLAEAEQAAGHLLRDHPANPAALELSIRCRRRTGSWQDLATDEARLLWLLRDEGAAPPPVAVAAASDRIADHRLAAERWTAAIAVPRAHRHRHIPRVSRGKIRLGYLIGNLGEQTTGRLLPDVLRHHDDSKFEVFTYAVGDEADAGRSRDLRAAPPRSAAGLIRADEINILVDVTADRCSLSILAYRPAPIQATLGCRGSLAPLVDFALVHPGGDEAQFAEKLVRVPGLHHAGPLPETAAPSRAEAGLPDKGFVFGCFADPVSITGEVFDVWAGLLAAVPRSVLWLLAPPPNLGEALAARGIAAERLIAAPRRPWAEHLARLPLVDLMLDTFPLCTDAGAALSLGVPVLTRAGEAYSSAVSAALLQEMGLPELVTTSAAEYGDRARSLAKSRPALARLRSRLLSAASADLAQTARRIEQAYERIWEKWCTGRSAQPIDISGKVLVP